jgi:hypothetical protein
MRTSKTLYESFVLFFATVFACIAAVSAVYVGCYPASAARPVLTHLAYVASGNNSIYTCTLACQGYSFLGAEGNYVRFPLFVFLLATAQ